MQEFALYGPNDELNEDDLDSVSGGASPPDPGKDDK